MGLACGWSASGAGGAKLPASASDVGGWAVQLAEHLAESERSGRAEGRLAQAARAPPPRRRRGSRCEREAVGVVWDWGWFVVTLAIGAAGAASSTETRSKVVREGGEEAGEPAKAEDSGAAQRAAC